MRLGNAAQMKLEDYVLQDGRPVDCRKEGCLSGTSAVLYLNTKRDHQERNDFHRWAEYAVAHPREIPSKYLFSAARVIGHNHSRGTLNPRKRIRFYNVALMAWGTCGHRASIIFCRRGEE